MTVLIVRTYFAILLAIFRIVVPNKARKFRSDEIVMIVGASRGIGQEIAIQIGGKSRNATVVCVDINAADNENTVRKIRALGGTSFGYKCDITKKEEVDRLIGLVETNIGNITMLFHCCSMPSARALTAEPQSIEQSMDVNILSYFYLLDGILPAMKRIKKGHIVFLTSVAGVSGFHNQLPLNVSQFAIQGLYESLVEEIRISKLENYINLTLVHVYPFVLAENSENDIRLRVTGLFGTIRADKAAARIIDGVRRNEMEISIPKYSLWVGHLLKILPRKVTYLLREFWDTGIDFM